jgi:hypothetical protein
MPAVTLPIIHQNHRKARRKMNEGNTGGDASPFRRRREASATSTLLVVAVVLAVAYGGYRAWSGWQGTLHAPGKAGTSSSAVARPAPPIPLEKRIVVTAPAVSSSPSGAAVVKCVAKGVTTYAATAADCPSGAEVRLVRIDPQLNLADGLRDAPAVIRAGSTAAAPAPSVRTAAAADSAGDRKARCLAYDEEIKAIDAYARQPLPGHEQDRLAALRKRARDEQFRLRC